MQPRQALQNQGERESRAAPTETPERLLNAPAKPQRRRRRPDRPAERANRAARPSRSSL